MALIRGSSLCLRCSVRLNAFSPASKYTSISARSIPNISRLRNASTAAASKPVATPASQAPAPLTDSDASSTKPAPSSTTKSIAQEIRNLAPSFTETYVAYGVCEELIKECVRVADYTVPQATDLSVDIPTNETGEHIGVSDSWWYTRLGLAPTFNTWAQITFLHMWLLTVRMRCFPAEHAPIWNQHLTDHFFSLAEDRMVLSHRLNSRMVRNKYLKDLFLQWRGLTAAYDEGLMKGDAVMAAAVWRNIFRGAANADLQGIAEIVSYMRSVLASFDAMSDQVLAQGDVVFGDPSGEEAVVRAPSQMAAAVTQPEFTKAPPKLPQKS